MSTTIITGPVKTIARVTGCKGLRLVTLANLAAISESWDTELYVRSRERLLIDGASCGNIEIYPYNVNYVGLGKLYKSHFIYTKNF